MGGRVRCPGIANYFIYYKRLGVIAELAIRYHPQSGWFDEGPQRGPTNQGHERA